MTILDGTVKEFYTVTDVQIQENIMRRLEALGINSGARMQLMNRKKTGTVIIKVRGTRWAMGRDIAGGILVEPIAKEEMTAAGRAAKEKTAAPGKAAKEETAAAERAAKEETADGEY